MLLANRSYFTLLLPLIANAAPGELLWSDEFDIEGQPNHQFWTLDLGGGGWGNSEFQTYTDSPENLSVNNGSLKITALRPTIDTFTSARIQTDNKVFVQYGTIEARIKIPNIDSGLWAAFWTLGQNFPDVKWPDCGEFDIMEIGGARAYRAGVPNRQVLSAVHWIQEDQHSPAVSVATHPSELHEDFHIYRLEWTPDSVTMTVDEYQTLSLNINVKSCFECEELHQPHRIVLNLAVGGGFTYVPGSPYEPYDPNRVTASIPATMEVDYVRVYDNGFTRLSGSAFDGPVTEPTLPETDAPLPPPPPAPITNAPTTLAPVSPQPTTSPTYTAPTESPTTETPTFLPTETLTMSPSDPPSFAPSLRPSVALSTSINPTQTTTNDPTISLQPSDNGSSMEPSFVATLEDTKIEQSPETSGVQQLRGPGWLTIALSIATVCFALSRNNE